MAAEEKSVSSPGRSDLTVSIIMPSYNAEAFLERAVRSVFAQTCGNWRLIIIDDGSTDNTLSLAQSLAASNERIRVIHQANAGQANATNTGITAAQTEWVACVDADDELDPHWAELLSKAVNDYPGSVLYGSNLLIISADHPAGIPCFPDNGPATVNLAEFLAEQRFSNNGAWMRRDLWKQLGGFRDASYSEDYDLIIRALLQGSAYSIPEPLYIYHTEHEGRKSDTALLQTIAVMESCIRLISHHYAELDGPTLHAACQQLIARTNILDRNDSRSATVIATQHEGQQKQAAALDARRHASRLSARLQRSLYHLAAAVVGERRAARLKRD